MDWFTSLQTFLLVVDNKSFSKAAAKCYTSVSSVSKQVSWLENRLKTQLLKRTTRSLTLTSDGYDCYNQAKELLTNLDTLKHLTKSTSLEPEGEIKVTAPHTFGETVLVHALPEFLAKFPKITLNLNLTNDYLNMVEQGIDVAIRTTLNNNKMFKKHNIGEKQIGLFAAPSYLKKKPTIKSISDLIEHECLVHSDFKNATIWHFKSLSVRVKPFLITNSIQALINSAIAGQGIIYLSEYVVKNNLKSKQLIPILQDEWMEAIAHYVIYFHTQYTSKKIECFINFIRTIKW